MRTYLASAGAALLLGAGVNAQSVARPTAGIADQNHNRVVELNWLGHSGARFDGVRPLALTGAEVSAAGDVDGDGLDDLLVAAPGATDDPSAGSVYLLLGRSQQLAGVVSRIDGGSPSGAPGNTRQGSLKVTFDQIAPHRVVEIVGAGGAGALTGQGLSALGDFNGDGLDDFAVGAPGADSLNGTDSGAVWVIFGRAEWPARIDLDALDASGGLTLNGPFAGDRAGSVLAGAGDVNGDGLGDLLVGASWSSNHSPAVVGTTFIGDQKLTGTPGHGGAAWLVFGNRRFEPAFDLDRLTSGEGVRFIGAPGDHVGAALSSAGDVDGDGYDDVLIGAPHSVVSGQWNTGAAYLVNGGAALPPDVDLRALGSLGTTILGAASGDLLGAAVAGGSDLNGDGLSDVAVGAPGADPRPQTDDAGMVFVMFGQTEPLPLLDLAAGEDPATAGGGQSWASPNGRTLDLAGEAGTRQPGTLQLMGFATDDRAGARLAMGGDLNGDGLDDLVVGADGTAGAWLVRGSKAFDEELMLSDLGAGGLEFRGALAMDPAFIGDMDGDGFTDLALGCPQTLDGAGSVSIVRGMANMALAVGDIEVGESFRMVLHGSASTEYLLLVSPSALAQPISTWRGDWWLGLPAFEVSARAFDQDGQDAFKVHVPDDEAMFAGVTVYWQGITLPQGHGQDLTGLLVTSVAP